MVPAPAAVVALLALKLLDKERRSRIDDFKIDEALGLFAGLNILPEKSFITDYSYRTAPENQLGLLRGWVPALGAALFPEADTFSLDVHPIPYRGDPTGLDQHYLPLRGSAGPSVQTFFALEQESRCLCYANANLTRADQPAEVMRVVEFWQSITGHDPRWLYIDSGGRKPSRKIDSGPCRTETPVCGRTRFSPHPSQSRRSLKIRRDIA